MRLPAASLLGLVAYERWPAMRGAPERRNGRGLCPRNRHPARGHRAAARDPDRRRDRPTQLCRGLAIGQSLAFAGTLVIGFALHNATEGFGIVAPLAGGPARPSWAFLGARGVIGGGPTVVGTVVGQAVVNTTLSVAFLGLAAG